MTLLVQDENKGGQVPVLVELKEFDTEIDDFDLFALGVEPDGILRRYAAGMYSVLQSSSTTVELTAIKSVVDDDGYGDRSTFYQVALSNGKDEQTNRAVQLFCGLEVHRTVGGKIEWAIYGPLRAVVSSREGVDGTSFFVGEIHPSTIQILASIVTRYLYGLLLDK